MKDIDYLKVKDLIAIMDCMGCIRRSVVID